MRSRWRRSAGTCGRLEVQSEWKQDIKASYQTAVITSAALALGQVALLSKKPPAHMNDTYILYLH